MDENKKENNLVPEPEESPKGTDFEENFPTNDEVETDVELPNQDQDESKEVDEVFVQNVSGAEPPEDKKRKRRKKVWAIVVSALLAVVLLAGGVWMILDPLTAVRVGSQRISIQEYEYYFKSAVSQNASTYSTYYGLDTSKDLSKQTCPIKNEDGSSIGTWKDFFDLKVKDQLQQLASLYDDAKKNKVTLNADNLKEIESTVSQIKSSAKSAGQSLKEYTKTTYGTEMSEKMLLKILRLQTLALQRFEEITPEKDFTDAELSEYYEKNKELFDTADFRYLQITIDTDKENGAALAKAKADAMLKKVTNEASFISQAKANATSEQKETAGQLISGWTKEYALSNSPEIANWLFDTSRKAGDKTAVTDGESYFVLYCVAPKHLDQTLYANARHILIEPEADASGTSTDAQKKAAKNKAEALYKKWQAGDKTEDSFAKLAKENSADTGSAKNGGLLSDIQPGNMVAPFNDWVFDATRKVGDTGIVESEYGYHIIYYTKPGKPIWKDTVKKTINQETEANTLKTLVSKTKYKVNKIGMKFVKIEF